MAEESSTIITPVAKKLIVSFARAFPMQRMASVATQAALASTSRRTPIPLMENERVMERGAMPTLPTITMKRRLILLSDEEDACPPTKSSSPPSKPTSRRCVLIDDEAEEDFEAERAELLGVNNTYSEDEEDCDALPHKVANTTPKDATLVNGDSSSGGLKSFSTHLPPKEYQRLQALFATFLRSNRSTRESDSKKIKPLEAEMDWLNALVVGLNDELAKATATTEDATAENVYLHEEVNRLVNKAAREAVVTRSMAAMGNEGGGGNNGDGGGNGSNGGHVSQDNNSAANGGNPPRAPLGGGGGGGGGGDDDDDGSGDPPRGNDNHGQEDMVDEDVHEEEEGAPLEEAPPPRTGARVVGPKPPSPPKVFAYGKVKVSPWLSSMLRYFNLTEYATAKRVMYAIGRMDPEDSERLVKALEAEGLTDTTADWDQYVKAMSSEFVDKGESQFAAQNLEKVRQNANDTVVQYMRK